MLTQDRRVRRTQQRLATALITVALEKGYETVTIRDITAHAAIGYATFFRHYRDKDALLHAVLDMALDELGTLLPSALPDADPTTVGTLLFGYVRDHSAQVRVLLGSSAVRHRLIAVITHRILDEQTPRPAASVPLEIAAHHLISATLTLIAWWLDHHMPYPPDQMGRIYHDLIAAPTRTLAFAPHPQTR